MPAGMRICRVLLWVFVVALGIEIGAGIFEMRVLVPRWAVAPPESVWQLHRLNQDYPQFMTDAGNRFWMFSTPGVGLLAILTFAACFATRGAHRRWLLASTILTIATVAATFIYFVPAIMMIASSVPGTNGAQITSMVHAWVALSWLRAGVYVTAWLCALRALTLSPTG
jgi:hypothetical protein